MCSSLLSPWCDAKMADGVEEGWCKKMEAIYMQIAGKTRRKNKKKRKKIEEAGKKTVKEKNKEKKRNGKTRCSSHGAVRKWRMVWRRVSAGRWELSLCKQQVKEKEKE